MLRPLRLLRLLIALGLVSTIASLACLFVEPTAAPVPVPRVPAPIPHDMDSHPHPHPPDRYSPDGRMVFGPHGSHRHTSAPAHGLPSGSAVAIVNAGQYGDTWPFVVDSVRLRCWRDAVWIETGGHEYGLNARSLDLFPHFPASDVIRRDNPEASGSKVSASAVVEHGLSLCP